MKTPSARKAPSRARRVKRRKSASRKEDEILALVRAGVERFILKDAPIGDFQRTVRAATKKGELSQHPVTGAVFRRIVREAIRERRRRVRRASRP